MQRGLIRIFVTLVAIVVIAIRFYRPEISVDKTTLALLALGAIPWLAPVIKRVSGLGFEIEFQDVEPEKKKHPVSERPAHPREGAEPPTALSSPSEASVSLRPDSYSIRFLKLTPAEIIAVYVVTNGMLAVTTYRSLLWANLFAFLIATPLFLWHLGVKKRKQLLLSTMAFLTWAFAIGGPFALVPWWSPLLGALALAAFTFLAPLLFAA